MSIYSRVAIASVVVLCCSGPASCRRTQEVHAASPPVPANTVMRADPRVKQREIEQQARPDIEKQRAAAQQQAESSLDPEAITAIGETQAAVREIVAGKTAEALAAIERATGKINILLARNPSTALIPVAADVEVIDVAPTDVETIRERARAATMAMNEKRYPNARVILHDLTSEIHARTYDLPLASYPVALQQAARLLDQNKTKEAQATLLTALNTLIAVDQVTPIPILLARASVEAAELLRDKDKPGAETLLATARTELNRAQELGYAGNDPEYAALDKAISDLETQVNGTGDTSSLFTRLRERIAAFFKRLSSARHQ